MAKHSAKHDGRLDIYRYKDFKQQPSDNHATVTLKWNVGTMGKTGSNVYTGL